MKNFFQTALKAFPMWSMWNPLLLVTRDGFVRADIGIKRVGSDTFDVNIYSANLD